MQVKLLKDGSKPWIKQRASKKIKQQERFLVNWLTKIRLKEKVGTQSTLCKVRVDVNYTIPTCVTIALSPFGRLKVRFTTEVMED